MTDYWLAKLALLWLCNFWNFEMWADDPQVEELIEYPECPPPPPPSPVDLVGFEGEDEWEHINGIE